MHFDPADDRSLARRDFLKVGVGFSLALTLAGTSSAAAMTPRRRRTATPSCSRATSSCSARWRRRSCTELGALRRGRAQDAARRRAAQRRRHLRRARPGQPAGTAQAARPAGHRPLRYVLTGVGAWNEAGIDKMQAFLARWRGSRFATLNAGGNVLVKLDLVQLLRAARELACHRLPRAAGLRVQRRQLLRKRPWPYPTSTPRASPRAGRSSTPPR